MIRNELELEEYNDLYSEFLAKSKLALYSNPSMNLSMCKDFAEFLVSKIVELKQERDNWKSYYYGALK